MREQTKNPNSATLEFKESPVKLAIESDQPIAQTLCDNVSGKMLRHQDL